MGSAMMSGSTLKTQFLFAEWFSPVLGRPFSQLFEATVKIFLFLLKRISMLKSCLLCYEADATAGPTTMLLSFNLRASLMSGWPLVIIFGSKHNAKTSTKFLSDKDAT